jgi:hypothetical protein
MTTAMLLAAVVWGLACPLWLPSLPAPIRLITLGACMLLTPGLAWTMALAPRRRHPAVFLACVVMTATLATVVVAIGHRSVGVVPSAWSWWAGLGAVSAVGFGWAAHQGPRHACWPRGGGVAIACGAVALAGYAVAATVVVPPQPDHDFEVQASAYGLVTRGEPRMVTDRGWTWTFAHPPLLHVLVGGTFALSGSLSELSEYDRLARAVPGTPTLEDAQVSLARYLAAPFVVESRAVNVVFAAITVGVLAFWTGRRSGRWWMGLLAASAYATSVDVVVRSSYGGYFAITQLGVLLTLWVHSTGHLSARLTSAWGAWVLLVDHKALLLPMGLLLAQWRRPTVRALVVGAALGTLAFWAWGLWIAREAFLADHVFGHLLDRVRHHNPLAYGGYPSPVEVWWQLIRYSGPVVPCGLLLVVARPHLRPWLMWMMVMALAFTVVDWRMTKHLMPLLVLAHVAVVPLRGDGRGWRALALVVWGGHLLWNARLMATLIDSFESIRVTPGW